MIRWQTTLVAIITAIASIIVAFVTTDPVSLIHPHPTPVPSPSVSSTPPSSYLVLHAHYSGSTVFTGGSYSGQNSQIDLYLGSQDGQGNIRMELDYPQGAKYSCTGNITTGRSIYLSCNKESDDWHYDISGFIYQQDDHIGGTILTKRMAHPNVHGGYSFSAFVASS